MRHPGSEQGRLPLPRPCATQGDVDAVAALLRGGELGTGRCTQRFEAAFGRAVGAPHAAAVATPSAAFQLACQVLGVGPGREVWWPANAPLAAAVAVQACGGTVEFLEVERTSGNLDLRALEERLARGPGPHVLGLVHHAGLPCDLEWLLALKRRHDFALIEDATEALGARQRIGGRWVRVGEQPEVEATVFSFDVGALVTTGRGGAVSTHEAERAVRLRQLRTLAGGGGEGSLGRPVRELGSDCALGDLAAALGASQLESMAERASACREIALRYAEELGSLGLTGSSSPAVKEPAWSRFLIQCEPGERDALCAFLTERRIEAETLPAPLTALPWFLARARATPCPNAAARARTFLALPIHAALSHAEQGRVIAALAQWKAARRAA